jgi:outer membrane lipoprotein LolB
LPLLPCLAAVLLVGCAVAPTPDPGLAARESAYSDNAARVQRLAAWTLEGRLAISDESDGGSGYFRWQQEGARARMDFHGALGRGAWQLVADGRQAVLEFADGSTYRADSIDDLVRGQVGWPVPVDSLAWWVRGLAAPGAVQDRQLDAEGRLSELQQADWRIQYGRYGDVGNVVLPLRMTARQEQRTVKLAVRNWELPDATGN